MDAIRIAEDGAFDSGPVAVTTSTSWQKICTLHLRGDGAAMLFKTAGNTIGDVKYSEGMSIDDANHIDIDHPFETAYPIPAASVASAKVQRAVEVSVWAKTAGGANTTLQVSGTRLSK